MKTFVRSCATQLVSWKEEWLNSMISDLSAEVAEVSRMSRSIAAMGKTLFTPLTSCSLLVSPLLWHHLICCSKTSIYRRYYSATGQRVRWEFQRRASLTTECQGIFVVISFTASCRFHQWCVSYCSEIGSGIFGGFVVVSHRQATRRWMA